MKCGKKRVIEPHYITHEIKLYWAIRINGYLLKIVAMFMI